jgi:hypothetical protein
MPTEPFQLQVDIRRPDVVEWLRTVPPDKLPQVVENTLAAGNLALSLLQASSGEESMQRFFRPVLEPMMQLKDTIEDILKASQKSQRLGQMGENIVCEQLKTAFPEDDFELVSAEGHRADIHATFVVGRQEKRKALIEVKLYSDDVPSEEIEKFRRDLDATGFGYGLFVSLGSRLAGISGPLHLEESSKCLAVYVPNAGLDGHRLLCAAAMVKAIVLYQARARSVGLVPTDAIEQAWARLNSEVQELKGVSDELGSLKRSLQATQRNVEALFGKLTERAISADWRLRYSVDRITNRLVEELVALPIVSTPSALAPPADPDAILRFLASLRDGNDGRLRYFEALHDACQRLGLRVAVHDNHWQLQRDGKVVAWTDGSKSRLDVCIHVDIESNPEIVIDARIEKMKGKHLVIEGRVVELMIERLEKRLR